MLMVVLVAFALSLTPSAKFPSVTMLPVIESVLPSLLVNIKALASNPSEVILPKKFNVLEFAPAPKSIILSVVSVSISPVNV